MYITIPVSKLNNYLSISQILFGEKFHFSLVVGILQVGVESLVRVAHTVVDEIHVARCGGQIQALPDRVKH